jgi:hypothetical protein
MAAPKGSFTTRISLSSSGCLTRFARSWNPGVAGSRTKRRRTFVAVSYARCSGMVVASRCCMPANGTKHTFAVDAIMSASAQFTFITCGGLRAQPKGNRAVSSARRKACGDIETLHTSGQNRSGRALAR